MSITRLRALVQFVGHIRCLLSKADLSDPVSHLPQCNLRSTQAVGNEIHSVFHCPRFGAIRAQYPNLFQNDAGSMRLFMWHEDQKAVSHCLTANLQMAQT